MRREAWAREDAWRQQQLQEERDWKAYLQSRDAQRQALAEAQEARQAEYQRALMRNISEDNTREWLGMAGRAVAGVLDRIGGAADWMLKAGQAMQAQRDREMDNRRQALSVMLTSLGGDINAAEESLKLAIQAKREASADLAKLRPASEKIPGAAKGMEVQYVESDRAIRALQQRLAELREKRLALEKELASLAGIGRLVDVEATLPSATGTPPRQQNFKLPPTTQPKLAIPSNSSPEWANLVRMGLPHGASYIAPDGSLRVRNFMAATWKDDPVWGSPEADTIAQPPVQLPADVEKANDMWLQLAPGTPYIDPSGALRVKP
jgi:hypothetical protein